MKTALFFFANLCLAATAHAELKIEAPDCNSYGPTPTSLVVVSDAMEGGQLGIGYENLAGLNDFSAVKGCDQPSIAKDVLSCKGKGVIGKVGKFAVPEDDSDDTPRAPLTLSADRNFSISGGCDTKKHEKLVFEVK